MASKSYHEKFLNIEFQCDKESLCEADPVGGVHRLTGRDMIREQAPGPPVLVPVMVEAGMNMITDLMNQIIVESCI